jgi:hypothetical protein
MIEENLKFIRIGGPRLSDAAYDLPKSPLGRQGPLRTTGVRTAKEGLPSSIKIPKSGIGVPFIASDPKPND